MCLNEQNQVGDENTNTITGCSDHPHAQVFSILLCHIIVFTDQSVRQECKAINYRSVQNTVKDPARKYLEVKALLLKAYFVVARV